MSVEGMRGLVCGWYAVGVEGAQVEVRRLLLRPQSSVGVVVWAAPKLGSKPSLLKENNTNYVLIGNDRKDHSAAMALLRITRLRTAVSIVRFPGLRFVFHNKAAVAMYLRLCGTMRCLRRRPQAFFSPRIPA